MLIFDFYVVKSGQLVAKNLLMKHILEFCFTLTRETSLDRLRLQLLSNEHHPILEMIKINGWDGFVCTWLLSKAHFLHG